MRPSALRRIAVPATAVALFVSPLLPAAAGASSGLPVVSGDDAGTTWQGYPGPNGTSYVHVKVRRADRVTATIAGTRFKLYRIESRKNGASTWQGGTRVKKVISYLRRPGTYTVRIKVRACNSRGCTKASFTARLAG